MTPECERVLDQMDGPLPPDLASHAAGCADCRALLAGFHALGPPASVPSPTPVDEARLEQTRRQSLTELAARPRPTPWWKEVAVLLATYLVVGVLGLFVVGRHGMMLNAASPWAVALVALLIVVGVGGGAMVALAPMRRAWPFTLVASGALVVALAQLTGRSGVQARPFLAGTLGCMGAEVALSVVPLALALVLLCRSAFQPVRALAAGLSSAGVSLLVLHVHCPDGSAGHLMLGHVLPWLVLAGVAVFIRSRLPSRSFAP
ncbi:NrsF family protein [Corallococcus sp. EGB]|uniref:NrsF family protein n=1 Tax=Corallococcus sp. EGB TaxID=1521117 RepID=UPI001CBED3D0|nr:NrsF family protein [Corallococcus sp. EGB]